MKKSIFTLGAAVAAIGSTAFGAELRELTFQTAMPAASAPKIDGVLDDACWKTATVHSDYYEYLKPNPRRVTNTKTDCMIVYDAAGVYTGIRNWEDQPEKLRQNVTKDFQGEIWTDDCGEIFYDPDASGIGFYKFIVNSLGKYDTAWRMDSANMDENWVCSGVKCAAKVFKDRWEVELFIPWSAFHNRPGPKPGDIWTFNHSRFRFGALGWGAGFSTTAPGGSGVSANKFGYLYFSDGSKPDAKKVLSLLEQRLNTNWGIMIDGKVYVHDLKGTNVSDLDAEKRELEREFREHDAKVGAEIEAAKRGDLKNTLGTLRIAFTNELAKYDASFASVKQFRELVDKVRVLAYELKCAALADPEVKGEPIEMPLAGKYDLNPPKEYNGHNGWYRHNRIKNALVTPHLEWCPETIGPAPHPMFITGLNGTLREAVELEQRFAYEDALFHPGGFGATGIYEDPLSHGTFLDKQAQFETLLAKKPDVFVLQGFYFSRIPAHYRYEMLRRVRDDGVGLVLLGVGGVDRALTAKLTRDDAARRTLARLVPYAQVPGASCPRNVPAGQTATELKLNLYRFGKGRIAQVDQQGAGEWSLLWKGAFETRAAFAANAIRWAQGAEPAAAVAFASGRERDEMTSEASFFGVEVDTKDSGVNRVRLRLRSSENVVLKDETRSLASGKNSLAVDLRDVPAGDYYLDVIPAAKPHFGAAKWDFAAVHQFSKASRIGAVTIDGTNRTIIAEGTGPTLRVAWQHRAPADGVLKYEVADQPYRQVRIKGETPFKAGATSANLPLPKRDFPTLSGVITAKVVAGGEELACARKFVYFPNHRFPDYTMIMWEGLWQGGIAELFAPQLIDVMGYENHLGEAGSRSAEFNGRAVPHITRVCLGGSKKGTTWSNAPQLPAKTQEEKDYNKKIMADYNVYRPEVREYFEKAFTPRVQKCAPYGVCVYNLGDECFYSNGLGFGDEQDEGYFRDFIAKRYGKVEVYNAVHGTTIKDWKEVVHLTCEEAKKSGDWPSWFDQTSYSAKLYSDTFQLARSVIKKYDPKGRVGAEGSPSGNLEETVKNLEFWGPYGDVYLDEVLKCIAPDRVRGMWWGGYLRSQRDGFPGRQWEYLLTGRANGDEWFSAIIGSTESSFAGDLTLAPYVQKLHANHAQLKHGLASYMIRTPLRKDGFAIYYSWPSTCATTLSDEFKSPAEGGRELIRFCYRKGLEVSFVTPSTLKTLEQQKLVFLPGICSLSDGEVAALKAFVKRGGRLYADAEPGVLDQYLARRQEAPLKGLWTKYERGADDAALIAVVGTVGVKQRERVSGLPDAGLVLRVRETAEQKAVGFTTSSKNCGKAVTLDFGSEGWIYECDVGLVGKGDKVEIAALERPFKLYAQFKAEQTAPEIKLDRTEVQPGDFVKVATGALRKGGVYRLGVKDGEGREIQNREQIVIVPEKPTDVSLQFPYSDAGDYTVTLRDLATGLESSRPVRVSNL